MSERALPVALFLGLGLLVAATGCQSQPQATPEPTATENVVVVVITATPQPTLESTQVSEPTITPLATFTPIGTIDTTATSAATATRKPTTLAPGTPKPVKTNTTVPAVASPTAAVSRIKYQAPMAISPTTGDSNSDHADIQFYFFGVGPLGTNECYLLYVAMSNPNAPSAGPFGDDFLDTAHCGNQSPLNSRLKFVLLRPRLGSPSYGSIESVAQQAAPSDLLKVLWYVRVVQDNGLGPDGVHHNTTPLSPNSMTLESDFLR